MCRLYARLSLDPQSSFNDLCRARFSLLRQSSVNPKALQTDGWGILGRQASGWRGTKSKGACFKEPRKFKRTSKSVVSHAVLAHIRRASNPGKLPRGRLIHTANCQPFVYRDLAFAHNGTLNIPDEVARGLGRFRSLIQGVNDSEVLFAAFVKHWVKSKGASGVPQRWRAAFKGMIREVLSAWKKIPRQKRAFPAPFAGLNIMASDGKTLAAHCLYGGLTPKGSDPRQGRSLSGQGRPYFEMCYNVSLESLTAASEPLDSARTWKRLKSGKTLVGTVKNGKMNAQIFPGGLVP